MPPPVLPCVQASLPLAIGSTSAAAVAARAGAGPLEWNKQKNSSIFVVTTWKMGVVSPWTRLLVAASESKRATLACDAGAQLILQVFRRLGQPGRAHGDLLLELLELLVRPSKVWDRGGLR